MIDAPDPKWIFRRLPPATLPSTIWRAHGNNPGAGSGNRQQQPGIAEYIVEQEQLTVQFLGDLDASRPARDSGEPTRSHRQRIKPNSVDQCASRINGASFRRGEESSRTSRRSEGRRPLLPADRL